MEHYFISATAPEPAPLPSHRYTTDPGWQELWRRHAHITTPLRTRGLECDIEFGLNSHVVYVALPDDSYLIIAPPYESSAARPAGDPEGWIVTRESPDDPTVLEVVYDSTPGCDPGVPPRPEARNGGAAVPLIQAIDQRLEDLGLLPDGPPRRPPASARDQHITTPPRAAPVAVGRTQPSPPPRMAATVQPRPTR
ncbi:hypothetical protein [Streptomyces sp. NPDC057682]|uniref:hypothetical protein n=1 Tax=Streptomyces sp. NPDC057682 TaxID=3346210 RepID=UPI0036CBD030